MATWNGVITNAGNSLLNEWVNEKTLNFDSAAAGQGTVAAAAMMAQTALVNEKQTASLLGGERVSSGIRLKLRIAAPNTAYNGIIRGGNSDEFNGMWEDMMTREQLVTVLYRFAQKFGLS